MSHTKGIHVNTDAEITWFTFCNRYNDLSYTDEIGIAGHRCHRLYYDEINE